MTLTTVDSTLTLLWRRAPSAINQRMNPNYLGIILQPPIHSREGSPSMTLSGPEFQPYQTSPPCSNNINNTDSNNIPLDDSHPLHLLIPFNRVRVLLIRHRYHHDPILSNSIQLSLLPKLLEQPAPPPLRLPSWTYPPLRQVHLRPLFHILRIDSLRNCQKPFRAPRSTEEREQHRIVPAQCQLLLPRPTNLF